MTIVNDELLEAFADTFLTYGPLQAPYWFLGLEEGGGNSEEEVKDQLLEWHNLGRASQMGFETKAESGNHFFREINPPLQTTWRQQIRILFNALDRPVNNDAIREFQANSYGRNTPARGEPNTCVMELFPLPRPNHNYWPYNEISKSPRFQSITAYKEYYSSQRILKIEQLAREHQPEFIVGFCLSEIELFERWLSSDKTFIGNGVRPRKAVFGNIGTTRIVIAHHPNCRLSDTNNFYDNLGKLLRSDNGGNSLKAA